MTKQEYEKKKDKLYYYLGMAISMYPEDKLELTKRYNTEVQLLLEKVDR